MPTVCGVWFGFVFLLNKVWGANKSCSMDYLSHKAQFSIGIVPIWFLKTAKSLQWRWCCENQKCKTKQVRDNQLLGTLIKHTTVRKVPLTLFFIKMHTTNISKCKTLDLILKSTLDPVHRKLSNTKYSSGQHGTAVKNLRTDSDPQGHGPSSKLFGWFSVKMQFWTMQFS